MNDMSQIFVISDGTGRTAEQALRAALVQFQSSRVKIIRKSEIRTIEQVHQVIDEALKVKAFIVHTLVKDEIREELYRMARLNNVDTIDLMGPFLDRLSHQLSHSPTGEPGLFRKINESYFRQIEAMQFAFKHDDGLRTNELDKAEIILLGVSRTFKTPLSIYLAFKLWFVANVPIIYGIEPPSSLFEVSPDKVFCLYTNPERLTVLRKTRLERFGEINKDYANPEFVRKECMYAQQIFSRHPKWLRINVTSKAIEEIASEIIALKRSHK